MIDRDISGIVKKLAGKFPIVFVGGPRQSGKSTLLKNLFPKYNYINLEDAAQLRLAVSDPKKFLDSAGSKVILDEVQRAPDLFSAIQVRSDEANAPGQYILSGSQNYLLMEKVSQSLAGRVALFNLLPFSLKEISAVSKIHDVWDWIFKGGYPRLYDAKIDPEHFYPGYIDTYIERDVRTLQNIENLSQFTDFMTALASRIGQQVDWVDISNIVGISVPTVKKWLSLLETSYIVFRLQPYYKNYNKRLTKSPKIYFYDTGLACSLLGINSASQLDSHWMSGHLFENFILLELIKQRTNQGLRPKFYFWRDSNGNEIDLIDSYTTPLKLIEIKQSKTFSNFFDKTLSKFTINEPDAEKIIYYGGDDSYEINSIHLKSWSTLKK